LLSEAPNIIDGSGYSSFLPTAAADLVKPRRGHTYSKDKLFKIQRSDSGDLIAIKIHSTRLHVRVPETANVLENQSGVRLAAVGDLGHHAMAKADNAVFPNGQSSA